MIIKAWEALYRAVRPLRRTTLIGPLVEALQLRAILKGISGDWLHVRVLGPDEFSPYLRALTPLTPFALPPRDVSYDYVIVRQDHLNGIAPDLLATLATSFVCTIANPRFALFEPAARGGRESQEGHVVGDRVRALAAGASMLRALPASRPGDCAIFMTTFNRPLALRRALPGVAALGYRVLVVDDGSHGETAAENQRICDAHGAVRLALPQNRGLVAAINIGLGYLLADRAIEWISYFQDDVDVTPDVMTKIRALEDLKERPLLTGYDADEHPAQSETAINGIPVKLKRSSPAVHLHGHATYWKGIWPLPSEYLGAPRRRWEASLEDYWIVNHAPNSVEKMGIPVVCVPNLVRTFLFSAADSTWGNPNQPDPPLVPR